MSQHIHFLFSYPVRLVIAINAKFNTKVANRKMQTEKSGVAAHAYLIWRERERLRIIERFHMTSR